MPVCRRPGSGSRATGAMKRSCMPGGLRSAVPSRCASPTGRSRRASDTVFRPVTVWRSIWPRPAGAAGRRRRSCRPRYRNELGSRGRSGTFPERRTRLPARRRERVADAEPVRDAVFGRDAGQALLRRSGLGLLGYDAVANRTALRRGGTRRRVPGSLRGWRSVWLRPSRGPFIVTTRPL